MVASDLACLFRIAVEKAKGDVRIARYYALEELPSLVFGSRDGRLDRAVANQASTLMRANIDRGAADGLGLPTTPSAPPVRPRSLKQQWPIDSSARCSTSDSLFNRL
jgi:hypothetical protein